MQYNNDLKVVTTSGPRTGASLSYITATPEEQEGPLISSNFTRSKIYATERSTTIIPPKTGYSEATVSKLFGYTVSTTKDALVASSSSVVIPKSLPNDNTLGKYTSGAEATPVVAVKTPKAAADAHTHTADDVFATKDKIWYTPDERYQLRELLLAYKMAPETSYRKVVVFTIPDLIYTGEQNIYVRFPWDGILTEMYAVCGNASGTGDMITQVQSCSPSGLMSSAWADVDQPLNIVMGTMTAELLPGIIVDKDTHFRLNILDSHRDVKGLTIELIIYVDGSVGGGSV